MGDESAFFHSFLTSHDENSKSHMHDNNSYYKNYNVCWGGGGQSDSLPSTFDTIHSIDLIFGTYNALSLHFQLIETEWCLIGFHGNHSHIKIHP